MERPDADGLCSEVGQALTDGDRDAFLAGCGRLYGLKGGGVFDGWIAYWEQAFDDLRSGERFKCSHALSPYVGDGDFVITRLSDSFRVRIVEDIIDDRLI